MIRVSRLNQMEFLINPDHIEFIEETPDTVISLESGRKVVVVESAEVIIERIIAYRRQLYRDLPRLSLPDGGQE